MNQPPEFLVAVMLLVALLICFGSVLLARYESQLGGDDFRFDVHRGVCAAWLFIAAASAATLFSRWIGARTPMVTWPWLGFTYWLSLGVATLLWAIFRWEARIAKHPYWPLDAWRRIRRSRAPRAKPTRGPKGETGERGKPGKSVTGARGATGARGRKGTNATTDKD